MKFGAVLAACRERAKLSQEQLAEMLNRSRSCISKIESDKKTVCAETLLRWTEATGSKEVAVAYFCGMDGLNILTNILRMAGAA